MKTYLKAFIAGMAIPALILPFGLFIFSKLGKEEVLKLYLIHALPIVWGVWNVLYFAVFRHIFQPNVGYPLSGALLGLALAIYGVFCVHLPALLGIPPAFTYFPLVLVPILYALVWRFILKPLNEAVGL